MTETVRELNGHRYTIVEQLPGATGEQDISAQRVRAAGQTLALIHGWETFDQPGILRFDGGDPVVKPFCHGGWRARMERVMERRMTILRDAGLRDATDAVAEKIDSFYSMIPTTFQPVLCHGDFSPDNVIFSNGNVVGVLDFDRAYVGHDFWELTVGATAFWMHSPGGPWTVRDDFYEAYRMERSVTDIFERVEPFYRIATLARGVAGLIDSRGLSEYEREFYTDAIFEAVDRAESC